MFRQTPSPTVKLIAAIAGVFVSLAICDAPYAIAAPPAAPLVRDRDPLLPDAFNPPRSLVFVTPDPADAAFIRFLGRVRPAVEVEPPRVEVPPQGVEVVDGSDADRDGYVEYFDGGAYVAELKQQKPLAETGALRFTGAIRETYTTTYAKHSAPHLLLRLAHSGGKHALVDAGPVDALAKLDLQAGDPVTVVARFGTINDRAALVADELTHESTTVKIVRGRSVR